MLRFLQFGSRSRHDLLQRINFFLKNPLLRTLIVRPDINDRTLIPSIRVLGVIEEGEKFEVLFLSDWIVLVRVALSTCHGRPHPHRHGRVDPINDRNVSELFIVGSTFIVRQGVPVESGCGQLLLRRILEEITSNLLNGELVKRFIRIQ